MVNSASEPPRQRPLPEESKLQEVRAQKRPDHPGGTVSWRDDPGSKENPPFPESVAGHTA